MNSDVTPPLTFRDFAAALMGGDEARAREILAQLLAVDAAVAEAATRTFAEKMATGPAFIEKAMSMRTAVAAKDPAALTALIEACFGLAADVARGSAAAVLARYP